MIDYSFYKTYTVRAIHFGISTEMGLLKDLHTNTLQYKPIKKVTSAEFLFLVEIQMKYYLIIFSLFVCY